MPIEIQNIIQDFIYKVKVILGDRLQKIILYGSYARGDFNKSSDIDIMILTDLNEKELEQYKDKIYDIAYDIESENNFEIEISPLIKKIDKYNARVNIVPFYTNVQREGVVL